VGWLARQIGLRDREYEPRLVGELRVPMRDGVRLRAHHYAPDGGGRRPTVLVRTPYGIGWHLPLFFMPIIARALAGRGYNVVLQDARGRYGSEGDFYPFVNECDDGQDTAGWIADQPWFDGRLGMWGPSYLGYTQWAVARHPPDFLRAIVPIVTSTDMHGLFYPGGAFSLISALRWASGNGERRGRLPPERRLPGAARTRPLRDATRAAGRPAPFFEDWADHPSADEYWAKIDLPDALRARPVPCLHIAGTYDIFCGPQLADFAAGSETTFLDLGPLSHGSYATSRRRLGWREAGIARVLSSSVEFLDHHLQGRPLDRARVRRYVQGDDRWTSDESWPPGGSRPLRLHLRTGGRLDREAAGGDDEPASFVYDPQDPVPTIGGSFLGPRCGPADQSSITSRRDVLVFETPPLERTLHVAGPVRATLHVESDAPATDFTAKLVHVPGDTGRPALNVCDGIRRLDPLAPGVSAVEVDLWHASLAAQPGDRLRLEVSSSNFPRYDAHPNVAGNPALATSSRRARQRIHLSRTAPSYLDLHVVG